MTTTTTDAQLLTLDTVRAERDGCLAYLVVDEASRAGLVIDPRLDQVDEILATVTARGMRWSTCSILTRMPTICPGFAGSPSGRVRPCWRTRPRRSSVEGPGG